MTEPKKPHHHGNLRAALIDAGIAILDEDGLDGLSLRKCAARAGVSHAAPAHHFGHLQGLKVAIAEEGFRRFRDAMLAGRAGATDPRAALQGIARGYLRFARDNPSLFAMIFSFQVHADLIGGAAPMADAAYDVLRDTCAPLVPAGTDPVVVETQVWALVHGYAGLVLAGRFDGADLDDAVLALLDRVGTGAGAPP